MKTVNIDSKGYGKIYKALTRNPDISLTAKAIYAYLCSYAGNGTTAFPSRDKITKDLQINKDTCTKHMNILIANGYITKKRTTKNNIYTIVENIPFEENGISETDVPNNDKLIFKSIGYKGFGTIPKLVVLDNRLSAGAKAIYAYFASFAGAGDTAFPHRSTILRELSISENTYYKHYNQLLEFGYIKTEQKIVDGKFDVCIYELQTDIEITLDSHTYFRMSENLRYGDNTVENSDNNSITMSEKITSEKLMSDNLTSEIPVPEYFGHAYNNNNTYNKQSYNHQLCNKQNYNQIKGEACGKVSLSKIKKWISYEQHVEDMNANPRLRQLLGISDNGKDDLLCQKIYGQIVNNLPIILLELYEELNLSLLFSDKQLKIIFAYENTRNIVDGIIDKYRDIYLVKAYLKSSVRNYILGYASPTK